MQEMKKCSLYLNLDKIRRGNRRLFDQFLCFTDGLKQIIKAFQIQMIFILLHLMTGPSVACLGRSNGSLSL